jgi:prevent-host-death family protein
VGQVQDVPRTTVNIQAAKTQLSRLVARAERGERITIARAGKPVAELGPARKRTRAAVPPDDPILNLDRFAVDGPGGDFSNEDIDRELYGRRGRVPRHVGALCARRSARRAPRGGRARGGGSSPEQAGFSALLR